MLKLRMRESLAGWQEDCIQNKTLSRALYPACRSNESSGIHSILICLQRWFDWSLMISNLAKAKTLETAYGAVSHYTSLINTSTQPRVWKVKNQSFTRMRSASGVYVIGAGVIYMYVYMYVYMWHKKKKTVLNGTLAVDSPFKHSR